VNGEKFSYKKHIYIMMNKPDGIVSASRDPKEKTVIDIVPDRLKRPGLFPAGRLDKDTTGFVLITDDGEFAHNILSPRHHIDKTYLAETSEIINESYLSEMRNGMLLGDEQLLEAEIDLVCNDNLPVYRIVLREGKYHQIKRMIASTNASLISLKRIKMGNLSLDNTLAPGECREITEEEFRLIY
jgi:16S rRNA pseudouridine516 synthase